MRRREILAALAGAAAARPLKARAQQPESPVIGFLSSISEEPYILAAFRRGLAEQGFLDGRNVKIEYRYAHGDYDRLPALATELVSMPVAVIVALPSSPAALAAKSATRKIPIAFSVGGDVVELGLVASYNSPGGNVTGVSVVATSLTPKRLELLHGLLPKSAPIALLVNPTNRLTSAEVKLAEEAARTLGRELIVVPAASEGEIDAGFESMVRQGAGGLVVVQEAYLTGRRDQIVALAQRHRLPAIYTIRQFPEIGGLISFGTNTSESHRQVGIYAGRILKGEKPADLPVQEPTKFELIINLKTAKALGLAIPPSLLARADEVIE